MAVDLVSLLPDRPPPAALEFGQRLLLMSMRHWLTAARTGQPVTASLRQALEHFGIAESAGAISAFMEETAATWPEPLRLYPLGCGCIISHDEWLLLELAGCAAANDRKTFDWHLVEMINLSARNRLWLAARALASATGAG